MEVKADQVIAIKGNNKECIIFFDGSLLFYLYLNLF